MAWILARKRDETQTETDKAETEGQERNKNEWRVQREDEKRTEMKTQRLNQIFRGKFSTENKL